MRIHVKLDQLLEDRGRSLRWLSMEIGRDYTTVWQFAHEKHDGCRYDLLEAICKALGVTPGDILQLGPGKKRKKRPGTPRSKNG
jgi:DNA-binding Xre family transcriptional regulator